MGYHESNEGLCDALLEVLALCGELVRARRGGAAGAGAGSAEGVGAGRLAEYVGLKAKGFECDLIYKRVIVRKCREKLRERAVKSSASTGVLGDAA